MSARTRGRRRAAAIVTVGVFLAVVVAGWAWWDHEKTLDMRAWDRAKTATAWVPVAIDAGDMSESAPCSGSTPEGWSEWRPKEPDSTISAETLSIVSNRLYGDGWQRDVPSGDDVQRFHRVIDGRDAILEFYPDGAARGGELIAILEVQPVFCLT